MNGYLLVGGLLAVCGGGVVVAAALLSRKAKLGQRRDKWHDQTTAPAGGMFNALFLAAFALSVVISWQAYDNARNDVANEASALVSTYDAVTALPNGPQLRAELKDYANTVLYQEWPLLRTGGSAPEADTLLRRMAGQILGLPADQDATMATRTEAIKELDAVNDARNQRLRDASRPLPAGLLVCLVISAVVALGHGLITGLPHTAPSLVPLAVEGAMVTAVVFVIFVIRQPYHGALDIGPDPIRQAITQLTTSA